MASNPTRSLNDMERTKFKDGASETDSVVQTTVVDPIYANITGGSMDVSVSGSVSVEPTQEQSFVTQIQFDRLIAEMGCVSRELKKLNLHLEIATGNEL